jgi:hypothetical protein
MNSRSLAALALAGALVMPAAVSRASPPEMPKPATEMSQLKFFDGSWTCDGKMEASPFGPGGPMKSNVKSHTDLGGFWQSGVVKGTSPGMPPFEGMFHMTYDAANKQYPTPSPRGGADRARGRRLTIDEGTMLGA